MLKREGKVRGHVAFETKSKRSIIAVEHPGMEDIVRVYVKGAPEIIISNCESHLDERNQRKTFDVQDKQYCHDNILKQTMTTKGFRTIGFSYKDYSKADFESLGDFSTAVNKVEAN